MAPVDAEKKGSEMALVGAEKKGSDMALVDAEKDLMVAMKNSEETLVVAEKSSKKVLVEADKDQLQQDLMATDFASAAACFKAAKESSSIHEPEPASPSIREPEPAKDLPSTGDPEYQQLLFKHKLYQLQEERDMKPETFTRLVSSMLYEKSCRPLPGLRNQLPAGLRAGAMQRLLQQLRHPGRATRRGRVRRRPLRPGDHLCCRCRRAGWRCCCCIWRSCSCRPKGQPSSNTTP